VGFAEPVMDMDKIVLTYDKVRDVMHDLKAIGAHNATRDRSRGLMGKQAWQRVEAAYEARRRDGKLPATYEVVYGHAWKSTLKKKGNTLPDGRQVIEFVKPAAGRARPERFDVACLPAGRITPALAGMIEHAGNHVAPQ
jgi:malonyl-CoA O-methyltransferase